MPAKKPRKPILPTPPTGREPTPKAGSGLKPVVQGKAQLSNKNTISEAVVAVEAGLDNSRAYPIVLTARRPDDMMLAEVWLTNMKIVPGANPTLTRRDSSRQASLVLQLPPQSFGEEALLDRTLPEVDAASADGFPDADGKNSVQERAQTAPPLGTTRIRMGGVTRLAFTMPLSVTSIPCTLEAVLLACRTWPMRRALTALPPVPSMLGSYDGDVAFVKRVVLSTEFDTMRRALSGALSDLGLPDASGPIEAAGTALAREILVAMKGDDDAASERIVTSRMQTAVAAIVAKFPALGADANGRALVEAGIGYGAIAGIAETSDLSRDYGVGKRVPLARSLVTPYRPARDVTAIEMPYRLLISPVGETTWQHRTGAVAHEGRNELWHTRLATAGTLGGTEGKSDVRAIWSDDYGRGDLAQLVNEGLPFRMPLDPLDRSLLVRLTAGFRGESTAQGDYAPTPFTSKRMILSALGGQLDAEGTWTTRPSDIDLEQWQHRMSLGRDHYVRVVYAGFLMPFGHPASLIKVTERKFEGDGRSPLQQRVARLRQRFFIVVREPVMRFSGQRHFSNGHPFPFTSVELLTRVTPNLIAPDDVACRVSDPAGWLYASSTLPSGLAYREAFWPMTGAGTANLRFNIAATDRDGSRTTFAMPLLFVAGRANTGSATKGAASKDFISTLRSGYNAETELRRGANLGGDSVCFAPPDDGALGDTRLPTETLRFKAAPVSSTSPTLLNAYPEVDDAYVALRAVQRILGRDDAKVHVRYDTVYAAQGFGNGNPGEVFVVLADATPSFGVKFGPSSAASRTDAVGAVASPSMNITAISRRIGMASDLNAVQQNSFNPASFFDDARILGGIRLKDVIARVDSGLSGANVPKFVTRDLPAVGGTPARTEARYDWSTTLGQADPLGILQPRADASAPSPFVMSAVTTARAGAPNSASSVITATMGNFSVNLFGFIVLRFDNLTYRTTDGGKPDVTVAMHPTDAVMFGGPLNFVNKLRSFLPSDGFSDASAISVTPSGISAGYSVTVPHAQVGVFALSGLSIGARFNLPFDTQPMSVAFNFATREDPFSLTISLLGGGGFLMIGVGADGVREIEAAIEAQARLSIDLGVASGSVEISVGIYFHWLSASGGDGSVELSGYVRVHGELNVMCVVSMSLTFNLQLGIKKDSGEKLVVFGEASVVVEVEVVVFSGEVTVRCRREFKNPEADPTFAQLVTGAPTWESYCLAFAAE